MLKVTAFTNVKIPSGQNYKAAKKSCGRKFHYEIGNFVEANFAPDSMLKSTSNTLNFFFDRYARAIEEYDTKGMTAMYALPCIMLSDDTATSFNESSKLEGFFNQGIAFYRQFGIAHVRPDLWMQQAITNNIIRLKVLWNYTDARYEPVYACEYHYIMRLDKHKTWKITLSISVNEKEQMEEWLTRRRQNKLHG